MNLTGERVQLRARQPRDYTNEAVWELDREIALLDPHVGKVFNDMQFSIETLNGVHIGICSLHNLTQNSIQLGVRIGNKNYWNKGYGAEVVNMLVEYSFTILGVEYIWLKVLPWNIRAIKCYEKCGFIYTGELTLDGYEFIIMERR